MLFVPDEDYVRVLDHTNTTTSAAAAADNDDDDHNDNANNDGNDVGYDEEKDVEENPVSPSLLFASQAQYLGHSNQVSITMHDSGSASS